jgi:hypothetical protein
VIQRPAHQGPRDARHCFRWLVEQIPYRKLYVPSRHDLSAYHFPPNEVLFHDPFNVVDVLWVINDTFQIVPVRDYPRIVRLARAHLSLAVEAPSVESVPVERRFALEFQAEHSP